MIRTQVDLRRPIEAVFDYFADFRNENEWNAVARDARLLTEPPIAAGSRFSIVYTRVGTMEYEISAFDRPRHLAVRATSKAFNSMSTFDFSARRGFTHVEIAIHPKPKGVLKVFAPLIAGMARGQLEKGMASLKRTLEARAASM